MAPARCPLRSVHPCFEWLFPSLRRAAESARAEARAEAVSQEAAAKTPRASPLSAETEPDLVFSMSLQKEQGKRLGANIFSPTITSESSADLAGALMVLEVFEQGLIHEWNEAHPEMALVAGDVLLRVNDQSEPARAMEELVKSQRLDMVVKRAPRAQAPVFETRSNNSGCEQQWQNWRCPVLRMIMRRRRCGSDAPEDSNVTLLPIMRAGDAGVDQCAICMEQTDSDDTVVRLECGHAFHQPCLAQWMRKKLECPLCRGDMR